MLILNLCPAEGEHLLVSATITFISSFSEALARAAKAFRLPVDVRSVAQAIRAAKAATKR